MESRSSVGSVSQGAEAPLPRTGALSRGGSLLVVNRQARSGASDIAPVIEALAGAGREPSMVSVLYVDDPATLGTTLAAALTPAAERIVIAGGDGTINSAVPLLLEAGRPLGIIPLGTANDLARTLNLPTDAAEAAAVIAGGRTRRIDVGSVNGKYFLNAAGIGFSSALQRDLDTGIKSAFGPLAYPIGVLSRWRRHRPFGVLIRGEELAYRRRVIQLTVANGRFYGGGMTAREDASIDDGTLDVLLILPRPLWRYLLSALSMRRGVYTEKTPVVAARATRFEVTTRQPRAVATDGEISTRTPAAFEVLPRALEVYVPDGTA